MTAYDRLGVGAILVAIRQMFGVEDGWAAAKAEKKGQQRQQGNAANAGTPLNSNGPRSPRSTNGSPRHVNTNGASIGVGGAYQVRFILKSDMFMLNTH